ncbi:MAG: hypothetical protein H5U16_11900 [Roseovarius sp.]|nr:hypothetical protein [Roseovarius sp.]
MEQGIMSLQQREEVRLDTDRLEILYRQLGESGAENVVCRALEEIAARLAQAERDYRAAQFAQMRKNCRSLIAMADQVGMSLLARVAGDVTASIDAGDGIALAATFARLLRIADRSLCEIWDVAGSPM